MPNSQPASRALHRAASALLGGSAGVLDRLGAGLADAARVVKYLRGRAELVPRSDDIYVVSYPRSGTTWTQFALHLLTSTATLRDRQSPFDFEHISQVVPWFERTLALGVHTASDFNCMGSPRVFKSHLPYRWLPAGARYVYLERDGMDVAVSYFNLYRSHLGYDGSFERFFERFLSGDLQYGSWFKHVAGWRARRGDPRVLTLRYEQLKRDARECLRRIAEHCELPVDEKALGEIADLCSFESMKRHEHLFDHATDILLQQGIRRGAFIRKGQVGEGRTTLSEVQRAAFAQVGQRQPVLAEVELNLPAFLH